LLHRRVVPELLQQDCCPQKIVDEINELLKNGTAYEHQMAGFNEVKAFLTNGTQTPSQNAAEAVLKEIQC
jgi:lipid-A-disaccharide synthase